MHRKIGAQDNILEILENWNKTLYKGKFFFQINLFIPDITNMENATFRFLLFIQCARDYLLNRYKCRLEDIITLSSLLILDARQERNMYVVK